MSTTEPDGLNETLSLLNQFVCAQTEINQKLQDQVASLVDLAVDLMVRVEVLESQVNKESASE